MSEHAGSAKQTEATPSELADTVREQNAAFREWALADNRPDAEWAMQHDEARALVAALEQAEQRAAFIPRETDEKPSDAMPSPGRKDWRDEAE